MMRLGRDTAAAIAAAVLLTASIGLSLAYWPGVMSWDSIRQYGQALSGRFDDWHPPMMEAIWRRLLVFGGGPSPMLVFQLGLYGAGFGLLVGWALRRRRPALALALAASSLMPVFIATVAAVIKDSLMAALLLAAAGLLAWRKDGRDLPLRLAAGALIGLAATMRFNAFLAGAPLLVALLPERLHAGRLTMIAAGAAAMAVLLLPMPVANRLLGAERSDPQLSQVIFDLGGITEHTRRSAFPPLPVKDPVSANDDCYTPVRWDLYAVWAEDVCPVGFEAVRQAFQARRVSPTLYWVKTILSHPIAYALHRLDHFNINVRFLVGRRIEAGGEMERPVRDRSDPNPWNIQVTANPALRAVDALALASARTPLGWPIVWMALAAGVLSLAHRLPSRALIAPLAASSLFYGLGYGVLSVSSELRYHLWTMLAALLAACVAAADLPAVRGALGRRDYLLALLPAVLVAGLGAAWRLVG